MKAGFFTRVTAKEARQNSARGRRAELSPDLMRALGTAGVARMNPKAKTPMMLPRGPKRCRVYVLGECPSVDDDERGRPLTGDAGRMLFEQLPESEVVVDNVCRTLPPGRPPTRHEVECFRTVVEQSIQMARPKVILGLGLWPLRWALEPQLKEIKAFRGKRFPVKVGDHVCWFVPTLDPRWLLRMPDRVDKVPADEWIKFWQQDVQNAVELSESDEQPEVEPRDSLLVGVKHCLTIEQVEEAVDRMLALPAVGYDTECHRLRPYQKGALLLSMAFSDGDNTWAIPIDHPSSPWAAGKELSLQRPVLIDLLRKLLAGPRWVAHNAPHDYEWTLHFLGDKVHEARWGCSQQAAFALNPGPPKDEASAGHRLEDLTLELFGLPIKSLTPGAAWVHRLREKPLGEVLDYNGLDAKWCLRAWRVLMGRLKEQGLVEGYKRQMERIAPIVHAQAQGIPIDQTVRAEMHADLTKQIDGVKSRVAASKYVARFERRVGAFNIDSGRDIGVLLRDYCKAPEVVVDGKVTTKKAVLESIKDKYKIVGEILSYRSLEKLRSTYVARFDPAEPESYIHADGLVHCKFSIARTRTARLSSEEPNNQNWPKRKNKQVRRQLAAPKGYVWVSCDQGQIEARGLAVESRDPAWVKMIEENYDVHSEWAAKIAKIDGRFAELQGANPKEARSVTKNQWVFPAFYGSSLNSIIRNLKLASPSKAKALFEEFWQVFAGVKKWQRRQWKRYERDGYVQSLTGRRRYGPLSYNMVINCVDYDTEALTKRGWIKGPDLRRDDWILTKNAVTNRLEWQQPTDIKLWPNYVGPVRRMRSKSFDAVTTPDHRWLVSTNGRPGNKCVVTDALKDTHRIHRTGTFLSAVENGLSRDVIELVGWFVTDGHIKWRPKSHYPGKTGPKGSGFPVCMLIQSETKHADRVRDILRALGQNAVERRNSENPHVLNWTFKSETTKWLVDTFPQRRLTHEFLDTLNSYQLNHLLEVMMLGDGHDGDKRTLACKHEEEAAVFQHLCMLVGIATTARKREFKGRSWWQVTLLRRERAQVCEQHVKKEEGAVPMWCPMVPNTYFVARRAGTVYVTGNTPIQTLASDICVDAMKRLFWRSREENKPWLAARLQIHDDLSFLVPEEHVEDSIVAIVEEQLGFKAPWLNVPLSVEVEVGKNLCDMEKVGSWSTTDLVDA